MEYNFKTLGKFLIRNEGNTKQLFIHYHNGYIAPIHREEYKQFKLDFFNGIATEKKYGIMYERYLHWQNIDSRDGNVEI